MKTPMVSVLFVLLAAAAVGADRTAASATPQPRARLDPITRASAITPAAEEKKSADTATAKTPESPVAMERYVVKGEGDVMIERRAEPEPTGPFTLQHGGSFYARDVGKARVEVGMWPWLDVFEKDSAFKPPSPRVNMDFVRVTW